MSKSLRKDGFSGYILVLFIAIGLFALLQEKNPGVKSITADEAAQLMHRDTAVVFLDVRTVNKWNSSTGHLNNAILIPFQDLRDQINRLNTFRDRRIIVYCRSGNRSGKAARLLLDSGFNAVNLAGGIRMWNARQYPVLQEKVQ
ncbi:MAG: rhodanese-like domain-containing protein [Ignavibacteriales bacterium]|nr:rhodanese-like domain-containing protein [Ignavibacteriales bacterium]